MILLIDNYDSFTYNLVQYFQMLREDVLVLRNDQINIRQIEEMDIEAIVISPGPGRPENAGICVEIVKRFQGKIPILGICLGHQVIGKVFGGKVVEGREPVHGKISQVIHNGQSVYAQIKNPVNVTRYHSLVIERSTLPDCLEITAETKDGEIMGIRHKEYLIEGIQFHPEAILTEMGIDMLKNFLKETDRRKKNDHQKN